MSDYVFLITGKCRYKCTTVFYCHIYEQYLIAGSFFQVHLFGLAHIISIYMTCAATAFEDVTLQQYRNVCIFVGIINFMDSRHT